MRAPRISTLLLAALAVITALAVPARSQAQDPAAAYLDAVTAELAALTAELDRAQEPGEFAASAEKLERFAAGRGAVNYTVYSEVARARYLLGEAEQDEAKREGYMDEALAAANRTLMADQHYAKALYWRSMAYLQKADITGGLSALKMVKRALADFEKVEASEPGYDGAGAYRSHGQVLMEAPAWAFIGDKKRGVQLLEKSKAVSPGTLINRLYLAEAYDVTGRRDDAVRELRFILDAPPGKLRPKDDIKVKEDAARLMDRLCGNREK